MTDPRPFKLTVPQAAIDELHARLDLTRWPDEAPDAPWAYGTSLAFMRELVHDWRHRFDWRATEAALNAWPQFKTRIDGIDLHFLHVRGAGANPIPLLLSHDWPGSVLEFMKLIPLLAADGFSLVVPSLPGYGLSFEPHQTRKALHEIGAIFDTLMLERLGYARYGAQGGDWGSFVTAWLGANRAEHLTGIHLNLMPLKRDAAMFTNPSEAERRYRRRVAGTGPQRGDRLPSDSGHAAANTRLRARRTRRWAWPPGSPRSTARGPTVESTASVIRATR